MVFLSALMAFLLMGNPLFAGEEGMCLQCLQDGGQAGYAACLKTLNQKDLSFMSGKPVAAGEWVSEPEALSKLCRGIKGGHESALAIGLRLDILLDGSSGQKITRALDDTMVRDPKLFLVHLQSVIDFFRGERKAAFFKRFLWDTFLQTDFGYPGRMREEKKAIQAREGLIRKVRDPSVREARRFVLEMLQEKRQDLSTGI